MAENGLSFPRNARSSALNHEAEAGEHTYVQETTCAFPSLARGRAVCSLLPCFPNSCLPASCLFLETLVRRLCLPHHLLACYSLSLRAAPSHRVEANALARAADRARRRGVAAAS
jgi:hypothetical protein